MRLAYRIPCIVLGSLLIVAAYWAGLHGPFLLDDSENLAPLWRYLNGDLDVFGVVMSNSSGLLGRPLSMLSFLLDAQLWQHQVFGFKLTNLLIHLACAFLVWALLAQLLPRDPGLAPAAIWLAPTLALIWAALPIQVSTVLYVVQRMAMLSALFVLLALLAYLWARRQLDAGRNRRGLLGLWVLFPTLVALAALCKENGVLAVPLAAAIEFACFGGASSRRPRTINLFFALALGLPALFVAAVALIEPGRLTAGYSLRDFTLGERLMTQPRVLWDYVASILVPNGPRLGLFHDDYFISRSWLNPSTTLVAALAWLGTIGLAFALRHRAPMLAIGIFFFLIAHVTESTVIALEIYFEHRNYLPSLGVLLAVAGGIGLLRRHLPPPTVAMQRASLVLLIAMAVTYLVATYARARVWADGDTLFAQAARSNPESPRLNAMLAGRAIERGDLPSALHYIDASEEHGPDSERMTATVRRMMAYCVAAQPIPASLYAQAEKNLDQPLTQYGMVAWELLVQRAEPGNCPVDRVRLARLGLQWVAKSRLAPSAHPAWRTRYNSARLLAAAGEMPAAAALANAAYAESGYNFGVGVLAFQTCASVGDLPRCEPIARRLEASANPHAPRDREAAALFMQAVRK